MTLSWEASDQRQHEAEVQAEKSPYQRALEAAAVSVLCCPRCGAVLVDGWKCPNSIMGCDGGSR